MASAPLPLAPGSRPGRAWAVARLLGLVGFVAVLVGLGRDAEATTALFWRGVVPFVPVVVLIHPTLWRNVCPLATVSISGADEATTPTRTGPLSFWGPAILLLGLIALRPLGLEDSGAASAGLLLGLGTAAAVGRSRPRKAGFCNRLCPVLAVEQLYGQAPIVRVENARCDGCSRCTSIGCLDLSPRAASAQLLGRARRSGTWLRTPLGAFAGIFPGIVLAFSTLPADPSAVRVLGSFVSTGLASWLAAALVVRVFRPHWREALRGLASVSAALYLGFALPGAAQVWGWPEGSTFASLAGVGFVLAWFLLGRRAPRPLV